MRYYHLFFATALAASAGSSNTLATELTATRDEQNNGVIEWETELGWIYELEQSENLVDWEPAPISIYGFGQGVTIQIFDAPENPGPPSTAPSLPSYDFVISPFSDGRSLVSWIDRELGATYQALIDQDYYSIPIPPLYSFVAQENGEYLYSLMFFISPKVWQDHYPVSFAPSELPASAAEHLEFLTGQYAAIVASLPPEAPPATQGVAEGIGHFYRVRYFEPDTDLDGLSDALEFSLSTDPFHWDTDGDGIPDGIEAQMGLDPKVPTDGSVDSDRDGIPDLIDYDFTIEGDRVNFYYYCAMPENATPNYSGQVSNYSTSDWISDLLSEAAAGNLAETYPWGEPIQVWQDPSADYISSIDLAGTGSGTLNSLSDGTQEYGFSLTYDRARLRATANRPNHPPFFRNYFRAKRTSPSADYQFDSRQKITLQLLGTDSQPVYAFPEIPPKDGYREARLVPVEFVETNRAQGFDPTVFPPAQSVPLFPGGGGERRVDLHTSPDIAPDLTIESSAPAIFSVYNHGIAPSGDIIPLTLNQGSAGDAFLRVKFGADVVAELEVNVLETVEKKVGYWVIDQAESATSPRTLVPSNAPSGAAVVAKLNEILGRQANVLFTLISEKHSWADYDGNGNGRMEMGEIHDLRFQVTGQDADGNDQYNVTKADIDIYYVKRFGNDTEAETEDALGYVPFVNANPIGTVYVQEVPPGYLEEDILLVFAHEAGHVLYLNHRPTWDKEAVMYPAGFPNLDQPFIRKSEWKKINR